jgi:hypothetical protein
MLHPGPSIAASFAEMDGNEETLIADRIHKKSLNFVFLPISSA